MPLAPAIQAALLITPIVLVAGIAVYDANRDEINDFFRTFAEDIGLRERRQHAAWGAAADGNDDDDDEADEARQRLVRRRRSVEDWLGRRRAGHSRSGSREIKREEKDEDGEAIELAERGTVDPSASATGVMSLAEKEGLRRRGAGAEDDWPNATSYEPRSIETGETAGRDEDEEEAALPNAFEDETPSRNTDADAQRQGRTTNALQRLEIPNARVASTSAPTTPSTLALRTPTSEEDPMDFDMLDSHSEATMSHFESGLQTPTSEENEEHEALSTVSSWSAISSRVDEHEAR